MTDDLELGDGWYETAEPINLKLVRPDMSHKGPYEDFRSKTINELSAYEKWILGGSKVPYERFLQDADNLKRTGIHLFFGFEGKEMVGIVVIRTTLTPIQLMFGGNINICVRGDLWKEGYGTQLIKDAYNLCGELLDSDWIILTVDVKNKGAWKCVRKATFDKVNILRINQVGMPLMVYRFWTKNNRKRKEMV